MLNHLDDVHYNFNEVFELKSWFLPNIISDVIISFFYRFVGIYAAGKMFLSYPILLLPFSFLFCLGALNSDRRVLTCPLTSRPIFLLTLMVFPLIYQHNFNMGNMNYVFSVGVFF